MLPFTLFALEAFGRDEGSESRRLMKRFRAPKTLVIVFILWRVGMVAYNLKDSL